MKDKILELIKGEEKRQKETLMLIPSENYTYPEVRKAVGSVLMHKYAEGQPNKRYYQGNSIADEVEAFCEQQALKTFDLKESDWGVNVQPHSGCPANLAVYNALLEPGDKIMAMYLPDGGHLSHGWHLPDRKVTLVSKIWEIQFYHVDKKINVFDYEVITKQAKNFKPKLIISGGTAYPREIDYRAMAKIAKSVGAYYLADVSHEAGLIAGGANQSPFPFADVVTMTTHKTLRGPRGALLFGRRNLMEKIDEAVFPGLQGGPHLHTIAGIAIALEKAQTSEFKKYARQVIKNAKVLAIELAKDGLEIVSGGTDKHLVLIDLRSKQTNGWFAAWALEKAGIIANRNTIPYDSGSPYYPSGLRLGTPATTTRGMKEKEMIKIAGWIREVVNHLGPKEIPEGKEKRNFVLTEYKKEIEKDKFLAGIKAEVKKLCEKYPVPD